MAVDDQPADGHRPEMPVAGLAERQRVEGLALDMLRRDELVLGHNHKRTIAARRRVAQMYGSAGTYDPAGAALARLSGDELSVAAGVCASFTVISFIRAEGIEPTSLHDSAAMADTLRQSNDRIVDEVRRLVGRHAALACMVCARRVPRSWIQRFLAQVWPPDLDDFTLSHVDGEFPLLVTNIALDCPAAPTDRSPEPPTAMLLDSVKIALLCALHRVHSFMLNSAVRWKEFDSTQDPNLIASYVARSKRAHDIKSDFAAYVDDGNGVTGLASRLSIGSTIIPLSVAPELGDQHVLLENFVLIAFSSERDRRWSGYLSHPDAAPHLGGLQFDQWWSYWTNLHAVAAAWVGVRSLPSTAAVDTVAERDKLRLVSEAHNLGMIEVDRGRLRDAVLSVRTPTEASPSDYDAFVASLTWQPGAHKPEFIESPAIFYPSGPETMYWDLLRHGGVLPGMARRAARKRGRLAKSIGDFFEGRVHAALAGHPVVTGLRSDVRICTRSGREQLQIDHGFLVDDLLFLVESKSYAKTAGYFVADDVGFEVRARKVVDGVLPDRDAKLRELSVQIADAWTPDLPRHALYIVCTSEVEYIPDQDPAFWLDRNREIPRVCTLDELLDWLTHIDQAAVITHPRCIPLAIA